MRALTCYARRVLRIIILVALVALTAACPLGRGNKQVGEQCRDSNDCAGARCTEKSKICSTSCKTDADCGGKLACVDIGPESNLGHCDIKP